MPAVNYSGYLPYRGVLFGWDRETVSIKRPQTTGHVFAATATNVTCKADGEKQGLRITEAGAFPAYERKFFFARYYVKTVAGALSQLDILDVLRAGDTIADGDGVEWKAESVGNPGGADEHLEVLGHRAPVE